MQPEGHVHPSKKKVELRKHESSEEGKNAGMDLQRSGGIDGELRAITALESQRSLVLRPDFSAAFSENNYLIFLENAAELGGPE